MKYKCTLRQLCRYKTGYEYHTQFLLYKVFLPCTSIIDLGGKNSGGSTYIGKKLTQALREMKNIQNGFRPFQKKGKLHSVDLSRTGYEDAGVCDTVWKIHGRKSDDPGLDFLKIEINEKTEHILLVNKKWK